LFAVWPWHPVDLACTHIGEGLNFSAYLSLGSTTCAPRGTQENGRPLRNCWGGVIPHSLVCLPWEVVMKQFLITSRVQIRFGAFCPAHLRLEVQNRRLLSCSLQLAPRHQGLLQIVEQASDPFCVSIVLCGVWGKDH